MGREIFSRSAWKATTVHETIQEESTETFRPAETGRATQSNLSSEFAGTSEVTVASQEMQRAEGVDIKQRQEQQVYGREDTEVKTDVIIPLQYQTHWHLYQI